MLGGRTGAVEAEPETTALHAVLTCVNLKPLDQTSFSNCVVATEAGIFEEISGKLAAENQVLLGHFA